MSHNIVQYSENYDIPHFYEVSAKSGENVSEAFDIFFGDIHRKVSHAITI